MPRACSLTLVLVVALVQGHRAQTPARLPPPADIKVDYEQHVKPILASRCFGCHGPTQQQSGLRLDLRQNALRGGDYGVVIVPGKSAESKLIMRLAGPDAGLQMPPTGPLEPDEIGVLRAWIDQGADMPGRATETPTVRRVTEPNVQAFLDRIHRHDTAAVRAALATDASLARATDASGSTTLMHAAYAGTLETMHALITAGADINAKNLRRATALHWAIADPAKLTLLLVKGADVNAATVEGRTPLHLAATSPGGTKIVELLIEAGADINARTITGLTPLFPAVGASIHTTRLLLDRGANPNATSNTGATALLDAANNGAATVALLVERGADVRAATKRNETALANAAGRGDLFSVRLLVDKGADLNIVDFRGYTPLMHAAYYDRGNPEIVRLLLARGAAMGPKPDETAVSVAARRGETEVTRILRDARASGSSSR